MLINFEILKIGKLSPVSIYIFQTFSNFSYSFIFHTLFIFSSSGVQVAEHRQSLAAVEVSVSCDTFLFTKLDCYSIRTAKKEQKGKEWEGMKSGGTGIIGRFESGYKMNLKITCKTDCRETVTLGTVRLFLSTNKRDWKVSGKYWKVWTKGECVGLSRSERYTRSADWWVRSVRSVGSADSCGQTRSARLVRLDSSRLSAALQAYSIIVKDFKSPALCSIFRAIFRGSRPEICDWLEEAWHFYWNNSSRTA